jgi:hypothetical protein
MSDAKPKPPLPDELLDRGIGLLEGPASRLAERLLSSTMVLAPLSITMSITMRVAALLRGATRHTEQHTDARRQR